MIIYQNALVRYTASELIAFIPLFIFPSLNATDFLNKIIPTTKIWIFTQYDSLILSVTLTIPSLPC